MRPMHFLRLLRSSRPSRSSRSSRPSRPARSRLLARPALRKGLHALRAIVPLSAALLASPVPAQEWPQKPVRIIVPTAAGGQPDIVSRVLAQSLTGALGQPFLVENIASAGGITAITTLLRAPADGTNVLVGDASHWAIAPALQKKLPYDPVKDFAAVRQITTTSLILVVSSNLPVNSTAELVAWVRARPGATSYGSAGIGSIHHLLMETFKAGLGLDMLHVPYKGSGQSLPALVGGQVTMLLTALASVQGFAKDGRVKILGVTTKARSPFAPNVPPMADAGLPDFDYPGGAGFIVRAGTPPAIVERLAAATDRAVNAPEAVAHFRQLGIEHVAVSTPQSFAELIRQDVPRYARMAKIANVVPE